MTTECVKCGLDIHEEALDEGNGHCPYCEEFLVPPQTVLEQYKAIQLSGVTNMLEWGTVLDVAMRHEFHSLVGFLTEQSRLPTKQIEAISRGLDGDVTPAMDPVEIREEHENIEEQIQNLRRGKA